MLTNRAWGDVLFVLGFFIGYKAEFTGSGYFPWFEQLPSVLQ